MSSNGLPYMKHLKIWYGTFGMIPLRSNIKYFNLPPRRSRGRRREGRGLTPRTGAQGWP